MGHIRTQTPLAPAEEEAICVVPHTLRGNTRDGPMVRQMTSNPSWWEKIQELTPNGVGTTIRDTLLLYAFRGTLLVVSVAILVNVAPSTYKVINDVTRGFLQKGWNLCVVALALFYLFSEIMIPAYRQPRTRRHAILLTLVVGAYLGYKMFFGAQ